MNKGIKSNSKLNTCDAVFHLPHRLTATALYASLLTEAAHSRNEDIVISRPMMTNTTSMFS